MELMWIPAIFFLIAGMVALWSMWPFDPDQAALNALDTALCYAVNEGRLTPEQAEEYLNYAVNGIRSKTEVVGWAQYFQESTLQRDCNSVWVVYAGADDHFDVYSKPLAAFSTEAKAVDFMQKINSTWYKTEAYSIGLTMDEEITEAYALFMRENP